MSNSIDDTLINQYLSTACEFSADLNTEAETHYYLVRAMNDMRPSIIYGLARQANDQKHFADLLLQASVACSQICEAESSAARAACDPAIKDPHRADAIWFLILLAAGQSAAGDAEWIETRGLCRSIIEKTGGTA